MNQITKPTMITEAQYTNAFFLIDENSADHYLLWTDDTGVDHSLYLIDDNDSLKNTIQEYKEKTTGFQKVEGHLVGDETGILNAVDGYIFATEFSYNDLDLEALAEGKIEWI